MLPLGGLIKGMDIRDSSTAVDGVKDKVGISKFKDMASYNWIKTSVRTSSLRGGYGTPISTSGSTSIIALPGKRPGEPLQWSAPGLGITRLSLGPKISYRDYEHSRDLKHPMEDGVHCITSADRSFISSDVDMFASDHTLKRLIKFVQGDVTPFQLLVHKIGRTLFLAEKGKEATTHLDLGRSFQSAYTKRSEGLKESTCHQRFVQYKFDGLQCLVRFEADGCLSKTDRLMAAALTSDLVHSGLPVQPLPPALQMNLHASTMDFGSAFCSELSIPAKVISEPTTTPEEPTPGYHWSQAETLAEEDGRKQRRITEESIMKRAMKASMVDQRQPKRSQRQAPPQVYQQSLPKPSDSASAKQSATSPVLQHNLYLQQYPLLRFHAITKAKITVAREHLDMAEGEFQRALWLYYDPQGPTAEVPSQEEAPVLSRLVTVAKVSQKEARKYLAHCSNDYDKALRLYATKREYFRNKRLSRDKKKSRHDEAKYLRIFKQEEKNLEAEIRDQQVARQKGKEKMTIPHSALFTLHCASEKSASIAVKLSDDELLRLWITRIPSVITAYYDSKTTVTSITYTDIRPQIRDWENNNQDTLTKFSALLKNIKQTVEDKVKSKVILHVNEKHKMEIREAADEEKDVLSKYMTDVWLRHGARDERTSRTANIEDDGLSAMDDIDDEKEGGNEGETLGEHEGEHEGEEEEQELDYISDESSVWEREYEDSDDDQEKEKMK